MKLLEPIALKTKVAQLHHILDLKKRNRLRATPDPEHRFMAAGSCVAVPSPYREI